MNSEYTIYETGSGMYISPGRWNSPRDSFRARSGYWTRLPDGHGIPDLRLYGGEYDVFNADVIPQSIRDSADRTYAHADRHARPWAFRGLVVE